MGRGKPGDNGGQRGKSPPRGTTHNPKEGRLTTNLGSQVSHAHISEALLVVFLPVGAPETPRDTAARPSPPEWAGVLPPQNLQRKETFPAKAIQPLGSCAVSASGPSFPFLPFCPPGGSGGDEAPETAISAAQPGKSVSLLSTTEPSQASPAQTLSLGKTFSTCIQSYPNVPKRSAFPQPPWHGSTRFHRIYFKFFLECQ